MRSFTRLAYGNCFLDLGNAKAGCRSLVVVTNNVFLHAHNLDWDNLGGLGRWSTCFIRRSRFQHPCRWQKPRTPRKSSAFFTFLRTLEPLIAWLTMVLRVAFAGLTSRRNLLLENLALRHQFLVFSRSSKRPRLTPLDRALWAWLSQSWADWKIRLYLVQPSTVIQWHRAGFRLFWRWKSRPRKPGRQTICPSTIELIQQMSRANPLWGAPRIHGELLKLGLDVAQRTVTKYMIPRSRRPTSPNWRTFLRNHLDSMVSVDFLTVPTLTFQILYVFLVLSHHRRRVLHFNVVDCPSARWTAQQLREAFAFTSPPKYLLRDRDSIYV